MSGICGVITWENDPAVEGWLDLMTTAVPHRGSRLHRWTREGVAIAVQQRDGSTTEQLAADAPSGLVVAVDGRLDNRKALARRLGFDLEAPDAGDAGLVLAAVRRWEHSAWGQIVGDFACVVWDDRRRRVLAARDVMGMRSLHFRQEPGRFVFATEIAQVLPVLHEPPAIHEPAIARYLLGEHTVDDETAYAGISQLRPGTWLTVERSGISVGTWSLHHPPPIRYRSDEAYAEHFASVFLDAVADRMRPHRSIGVMLSGGLDSGAVAATAGRVRAEGRTEGSTEITALSWAFDELSECDERHISRHVVDRYELSPIDIPADDAWPLRDYPAHGPDAAWPRLEVFQPLVDRTLGAAAAAGVDVVMTGERGDEVVGGWIADLVGLLSRGAWAALGREVAAEADAAGTSRLRAGAGLLLGPPARRLRGASARATPIPPWLPPHMVEHRPNAAAPGHGSASDARRARILAPFTFARAAQLDLRFARAGVEFADPWSDRRIAELVLAIPPHLVNRLAEPKRLAREAMRGIMPEPARAGARKIEPGALFDRGFRDRERATLLDLTTAMEAAARGFVDEAVVQREVGTYLAGGQPSHDWWRPVSVEMWLRAHWPRVGTPS